MPITVPLILVLLAAVAAFLQLIGRAPSGVASMLLAIALLVQLLGR